MLVQCEFYEVDGKVTCDIMCEHCGEVAKAGASRETVTLLVMLGYPVLCEGCENSKCIKCGRFPTPLESPLRWWAGLCWECRDKMYDDLNGKGIGWQIQRRKR